MTISTVNVETEDNLTNRQQIPTRCGSVRVRSTGYWLLQRWPLSRQREIPWHFPWQFAALLPR